MRAADLWLGAIAANLNNGTDGRNGVLKRMTALKARFFVLPYGASLVPEWIRPTVILTAVILLIAANVIELRGKRRANAAMIGALDRGLLQEIPSLCSGDCQLPC